MMLHSMLRALAARGHEVDVRLSRPTEATDPYQVHGVRVTPFTGVDDVRARITSADLVVTHLENTNRVAALGDVLGTPVVKVCHNTHPIVHAQLGMRGISLAVYNSRWMAEDFAEVRHRGMIVRPHCPVADYAVDPAEAGGGAVTLVNPSPGKGAETFYALAERMPKRRFLAVGGAYGRQVVRELPNVEHAPHMPGWDMPEQVYARTRILLMPSNYESWGRAAVEAMCSGIPVIAHPTAGLRESLGDAGVFVDRDDTDGWAAAIAEVSRHYAYHSKTARARAEELDAQADADLQAWCAHVEQLAGRRRVPAAV
jgi:hypothetical protein